MLKATQREETYFAGAYWGARKESPEECARRAESFLTALPIIDPSFSRWFQQGKSRKDALARPIEPTCAELAKIVRKGKDRVVEEIGFRFGAWNGASDDYDGTAFRVTCGGYSERVSNVCLLDLPSRGPNAERVLTAPILSGVVRSMVIAWEPDSAVVMSSPQLQAGAKGDPPSRWIGWITYVARHRGAVPSLPAPVHIEPVEDKGTLIVLTPERFTVRNPEHVALAERVRELLEQGGLLKPLSST
ncbi:immunity 52 family protein [Corallococcus sp. RDP092CA]|uniref:immunity 52 family protein n=1 Tax=Corallococcus sp. RDP092CA TaxID=3109369 RepID=UPI0035B3C5EB